MLIGIPGMWKVRSFETRSLVLKAFHELWIPDSGGFQKEKLYTFLGCPKPSDFGIPWRSLVSIPEGPKSRFCGAKGPGKPILRHHGSPGDFWGLLWKGALLEDHSEATRLGLDGGCWAAHRSTDSFDRVAGSSPQPGRGGADPSSIRWCWSLGAGPLLTSFPFWNRKGCQDCSRVWNEAHA